MRRTVSIELREHRNDWFEVKAWVQSDDSLINFTEADTGNIDEARTVSAKLISDNIISGNVSINFYHSKPATK